MMSNDCARATPPKPPIARPNIETITTPRRITYLLFIPNSAWLPREFIALPQKALQSNTSPEDKATRASNQTQVAASGLPRSFGGVMLAKLGGPGSIQTLWRICRIRCSEWLRTATAIHHDERLCLPDFSRWYSCPLLSWHFRARKVRAPLKAIRRTNPLPRQTLPLSSLAPQSFP